MKFLTSCAEYDKNPTDYEGIRDFKLILEMGFWEEFSC